MEVLNSDLSLCYFDAQYLPPGGRWPEGPEEECGHKSLIFASFPGFFLAKHIAIPLPSASLTPSPRERGLGLLLSSRAQPRDPRPKRCFCTAAGSAGKKRILRLRYTPLNMTMVLKNSKTGRVRCLHRTAEITFKRTDEGICPYKMIPSK